jgi:hypothetical protein
MEKIYCQKSKKCNFASVNKKRQENLKYLLKVDFLMKKVVR